MVIRGRNVLHPFSFISWGFDILYDLIALTQARRDPINAREAKFQDIILLFGCQAALHKIYW